MKYWGAYIILFLLSINLTQAQGQGHNPDSVEIPKKKKVSFFMGFDGRNSFVFKKRAKIQGLRLGLRVNRKDRIGVGIYGLTENVELPGLSDENGEYQFSMAFNYLSLIYEKTFYQIGHWSFLWGAQFGGGGVVPVRKYGDELIETYPEIGVMVGEGMGMTEYRLWRWIVLGFDVGYRSCFSKDKNVKKSFSAPVYAFRFRLDAGELWKLMTKKPTAYPKVLPNSTY